MTFSTGDADLVARGNLLETKVDAGAGPGELRMYSGTQPAFGGAETTLLCTNVGQSTFFASNVAGLLTADTIANGNPVVTDTATWARLCDSNGNAVIDMSIDELNLASNDIVIGVPVVISSFTYQVVGG